MRSVQDQIDAKQARLFLRDILRRIEELRARRPDIPVPDSILRDLAVARSMLAPYDTEDLNPN